MTEATAYLGVGANLEPEVHIRRLLDLLAAHPSVTLKGISTFYRTPALPAGPGEERADPDFLNGVLEVDTFLEPEGVVAALGEMEGRLGRVRGTDPFAPRTMDVDLLLYLPREGPALGPHPDVLSRPFVALPLLELAPELVLPGSGVALREVAGKFSGPGGEAQEALTRALRRAFLSR